MTYKELANDPEVLASLAKIKAKGLRQGLARKPFTIYEKRKERKDDPYKTKRKSS